jgi:two-component system, NtrC family, sensor histidine kinase PilS
VTTGHGADEARRSPGSLLAPASGRASQGTELFGKLKWLTLFRLFTITALLGGTAFAVWSEPGKVGLEATSLFRLVLVTYLASLGFAVALRLHLFLSALAYAQIALDVFMAAAVVSVTGYAESVFVFMFLLGIVNGSILLFRRGAVVAAALSLAVYLPLVTLASPAHPANATLFIHAIAFVATAALGSYLSELLRRTGKRLEEREGDLAAITALHESIVQSVASGLVTVDGGGRVTFLNRAAEIITGLEDGKVRGLKADELFAAFQPQSGRDETEYLNARGEKLRLGYSAFPLVGRDGARLGQAVIFQDLTELRAMEEKVRRATRLADLGEVAAGLAHELRNPLASMTGSIELLKGAPGLGENEARLMDIVLREAARLEHLVAAFLAFSRPASPRREEVRVDEALREALEVFENDPAAARVKLVRELAPTVASCDPDQLRQVFWNLFVNAAQAAGGGEGQGLVTVSCRPEGQDAFCEVEDDGPGIAPAHLAQLFTPFFTTKERGTGLGLATVQRIVDAHGGSIAVNSAPGKGTRVMVRIPAGPRRTRLGEGERDGVHPGRRRREVDAGTARDPPQEGRS